MASIDNLVTDVYGLFDGHSVTDGVHNFAEKIGQVFIERLSEKDRKGRGLSLSMIGRPLRQLYYELTGAPAEKLSSQTKMKFAYGAVLEEMLIFLAMEAGHEVTELQKEVSVDGIKGHIDCLIDGVLVDVKSCSTYSFNKFVNRTVLTDDPFGYIHQLSGYWSTLPNIKRAGFLAVDKVVGKLHFMELDEDCKKTAEEVSQRIGEIRGVLDTGTLPERCYEPIPDGKSGNMKLPVGCSYCSFKFHCHSDANEGKGLRVFDYSTGPKFLTTVAREPKVPVFDAFPTKED